jgi:protein TonB
VLIAALLMAQALPAQPQPVQDARVVGGQVSDRDYPAAASRGRRGGHTIVLFEVTELGRVSRCRTSHSSGHSDLDARACVIAERFRFRPARDAVGQPVQQKFAFPIWWSPPRNIRVETPTPVAGH